MNLFKNTFDRPVIKNGGMVLWGGFAGGWQRHLYQHQWIGCTKQVTTRDAKDVVNYDVPHMV
eukprot:1978964-Amphidinium_carterae.1